MYIYIYIFILLCFEEVYIFFCPFVFLFVNVFLVVFPV